MEVWPNLFIVGAPKAGTTSLYEYLKKIPQIYMSAAKEPYYFCKTTVPDYHYITPIRDKRKYLNLFKNVNGQKIIGEASIWYLSDPDSPTLIHDTVPNAKIIIMLRDPVERAFSHYLMFAARNLFKTSSFHEQLQKEVNDGVNLTVANIRLRAGLYYEDVKKYLEIFSKDQVKIIIFEEFIQETKQKLYDILNFLQVKHDLNDFKPEVYNPYATPKFKIINTVLNIRVVNLLRQRFLPESLGWYFKRHLFSPPLSKPKMLDEDRNFLRNYYSNDVKKIENLLQKQFPWPNFHNTVMDLNN